MDDTVQRRLTKARKLIQEAHDEIASIPVTTSREYRRDTAPALALTVLPGLDLLTQTIDGLLRDGQPKPFAEGL